MYLLVFMHPRLLVYAAMWAFGVEDSESVGRMLTSSELLQVRGIHHRPVRDRIDGCLIHSAIRIGQTSRGGGMLGRSAILKILGQCRSTLMISLGLCFN